MRGRRWTVARRLVQMAVLLFFLALPLAAFHWEVTAVAGTLASLRLGPVDLVDPAAALSAAVAAAPLAAGRDPGSWAVPFAGLLLGALPLVVMALLAGPVFCSWICPYGLVSEGIDGLRRWLGGRLPGAAGRFVADRRRRPWPVDGFRPWRRRRPLVLLVVLLLGAVLATPVAALLSPPRLVTSVPLEILAAGTVSGVTAGLLACLLLLDLAAPRRLWCRGLCPVGATVRGLRTRFAVGVRFNAERCTCPSRPACQVRCPWGLDPRRAVAGDGCTNCFACVDGCPGAALTAAWAPAAASTQGREPTTSRRQ